MTRPRTPPPRVAQRLMRAATLQEYRDDVLGDLYEEYQVRRARSAGQARAWYWSQTLRSLPGLLTRRGQVAGAARLLVLAAACALAYAGLLLWDTGVSRRVAQSLATQTDWTLFAVRVAYFLVFAAGAALAGFLAAALTFRRAHSIGHNLLVAIAPVFTVSMLVLVTPVIVAGRYELVGYLLVRLAVLAPALTGGAWLWARWSGAWSGGR